MFEFFFDAERFVPRGHCGLWHPSMELLYAFSNLFVFAAYIVIPVALTYIKPNYESLAQSRTIRLGFASFILVCGIGHLEGVVAFALPMYHLFAAWNLFTAAVSWSCIALLIMHREEDDGSSIR